MCLFFKLADDGALDGLAKCTLHIAAVRCASSWRVCSRRAEEKVIHACARRRGSGLRHPRHERLPEKWPLAPIVTLLHLRTTRSVRTCTHILQCVSECVYG